MVNIVTCMARCVKCSDVYFHEMLWGKKKWERAHTHTYRWLYTYTYHIPTACIMIRRCDFTWLSTKLNGSKCLSLCQEWFSGKHIGKKMHSQTWSRWSHMVRTYACKIRSVTRVSRREINWPSCESLLMVCAGCSGQHVLNLFLQARRTKCAMCKHVLSTHCVSVCA